MGPGRTGSGVPVRVAAVLPAGQLRWESRAHGRMGPSELRALDGSVCLRLSNERVAAGERHAGEAVLFRDRVGEG